LQLTNTVNSEAVEIGRPQTAASSAQCVIRHCRHTPKEDDQVWRNEVFFIWSSPTHAQ